MSYDAYNNARAEDAVGFDLRLHITVEAAIPFAPRKLKMFLGVKSHSRNE